MQESFFEPTTIHRTQFFVQKFGTNSEKRISGVTVTEFVFVFQRNVSLKCTSHKICPFISNKQIFSVTVTELNFVFITKLPDTSKKILKIN